MELTISENKLKSRVKDLYSKSKFKECITQVDENDVNLNFEDHYILQAYKGLSFFEVCDYQQAMQCFENIFDERSRKRGKQIDEKDLIIRVQFQFQVLCYCMQRGEKLNEILLQEINEYSQQHEHSQDYDEGVYRFGMGTYLLIETMRETKINPLVYEYLESAFATCKKYEQEILKVLCMAYVEYKDKKKTVEWCNKLYDLNPDYPAAAFHYGEYLRGINDLDRAEKILLECEEKCGYNPQVLNSISNLYWDRGELEKSKEYMDKMFALTPKTSFIYSNYGEYLIGYDQQELGLEYMKKAVELDPYDSEAYHCLINYLTYENPQLAIEYCEQYLQIYPNDGYIHHLLGEIQFEQTLYENAEINFRTSITLKNTEVIKSLSEFFLGLIYCEKKCYVNALRQFFNSCGYYSTSNNIQRKCIYRASLVCSFITNEESIMSVIGDQEGRVVEKFYDFASDQSLKPSVKLAYFNKLEDLRVILAILVYQKEIQTELTFKSQTQFWDLFVE